MKDGLRFASLLPGRNKAPLSEKEVLRAYHTFLAVDAEATRELVKFEAGAVTAFRPVGEDGNPEIVYGPDIYPGTSIVSANSALGLRAAVAHELSHYHRWLDKTELADHELTHLDEAMTSLDAITRYDRQLDEQDKRQLVADAMQRVQAYVHKAG